MVQGVIAYGSHSHLKGCVRVGFYERRDRRYLVDGSVVTGVVHVEHNSGAGLAIHGSGSDGWS